MINVAEMAIVERVRKITGIPTKMIIIITMMMMKKQTMGSRKNIEQTRQHAIQANVKHPNITPTMIPVADDDDEDKELDGITVEFGGGVGEKGGGYKGQYKVRVTNAEER